MLCSHRLLCWLYAQTELSASAVRITAVSALTFMEIFLLLCLPGQEAALLVGSRRSKLEPERKRSLSSLMRPQLDQPGVMFLLCCRIKGITNSGIISGWGSACSYYLFLFTCFCRCRYSYREHECLHQTLTDVRGCFVTLSYGLSGYMFFCRQKHLNATRMW